LFWFIGSLAFQEKITWLSITFLSLEPLLINLGFETLYSVGLACIIAVVITLFSIFPFKLSSQGPHLWYKLSLFPLKHKDTGSVEGSNFLWRYFKAKCNKETCSPCLSWISILDYLTKKTLFMQCVCEKQFVMQAQILFKYWLSITASIFFSGGQWEWHLTPPASQA